MFVAAAPRKDEKDKTFSEMMTEMVEVTRTTVLGQEGLFVCDSRDDLIVCQSRRDG